jgi:hypothetical protein
LKGKGSNCKDLNRRENYWHWKEGDEKGAKGMEMGWERICWEGKGWEEMGRDGLGFVRMGWVGP